MVSENVRYQGTHRTRIVQGQQNLAFNSATAVNILMRLQLNAKQAEWRYQFAEAWHSTKAKTSTARPIDCLICPCAPSAGFPHGFPVWWGYFSLWNLLDYPSIILPLKKMHVDPEKDKKDTNYVPKDNVFDKMNWEICKSVPSNF
jgi:amidase